MMFPTSIRRFAPLALSALFACNVNDSPNKVQSEPEEYGTLTPRILASGKLATTDTVHLRLRLDSAFGKTVFAAIDTPWSIGSVSFPKIPLNRHWFLDVYGTLKGDTVWSGTDSGTFTKSGGVVHNTDSSGVVVRNVASKPGFYLSGTGLASGGALLLGQVITVQGATGSRVAISTDNSIPACTSGDSASRHVVVAKTGTISVTAVACGDDQWSSSRVVGVWTVGVRDSVALKTVLDTLSGTSLEWNDPVEFNVSNGRSVTWKAVVLSDTIAPNAGAWSLFDAKTGSNGHGYAIDSVALKSLISQSLKPFDTAGRVLAKLWMLNGATAVDSIQVWWKIKVPYVAKPVPTSSARLGSVKFAWFVTHATRGTKAWIDTAGAWVPVTPATSDTVDTISIASLGNAKKVKIRLVGANAVTGRESDTVYDAATTLNPPPKPVFSVVNTNIDSAIVTLTLDPSVVGQVGVDWSVGYAPLGTSVSTFTPAANLAANPWIEPTNPGTFTFAVKSSRDGLTATDTHTIVVKGTAAFRPGLPQGLHLVRRTVDSLVWAWDAVPARTYRVYWGADISQTLVLANSELLAAGRSSYGLKRASGDSAWIAVVAQPGGDSTGGASQPSKSTLVKTKTVPAAPTGLTGSLSFDSKGKPSLISLSWNAVAGVRYVVYDSLTVLDTTNLARGSDVVSISNSSRTDYRLSVKALNSDSLLSTASNFALHVPQNRPIDVSTWKGWVRADSVNLIVPNLSSPPDSLRIIAPWASPTEYLTEFGRYTPGIPLFLGATIGGLRSHPSVEIQYRWKNGDTTVPASVALNFIEPPVLTVVFDVGSGSLGDTLTISGMPSVSGLSTEYFVHSKQRSWEAAQISGIYGSGVDSLSVRFIKAGATRSDTSASVAIGVDHRTQMSVTYRDGTTSGRIWTTRIGGKIWMAENLNWDDPIDTFDMCYGNDPANCVEKGRLYPPWRILGMNSRQCDTLPIGTVDTSVNCNITSPGICPIGWHLPDGQDWDSLNATPPSGMRSNTFFSGVWPRSGGAEAVDPYGMNIKWETWCYRKADQWKCFDNTIGTAYLSRTIHDYWDVKGTYYLYNGSWGSRPVQLYGGSNPQMPSYFPVRCVKD